MKRKDLTGKRFGCLLVKKYSCSKDGKSYWECVCDCGKEKIIRGASLSSGHPRSCGCLKHRISKHRISKHRIGSENPQWKGYGEISGRYFKNLKKGAKRRKIEFLISVEEIWNLFLNQNRKCALSGKEIFFSLTRLRYKEQTASLDRIDSNKGYTIDNIQWVHKDINQMKTNFKEDIFINYCKLITENKFGIKIPII